VFYAADVLKQLLILIFLLVMLSDILLFSLENIIAEKVILFFFLSHALFIKSSSFVTATMIHMHL